MRSLYRKYWGNLPRHVKLTYLNRIGPTTIVGLAILIYITSNTDSMLEANCPVNNTGCRRGLRLLAVAMLLLVLVNMFLIKYCQRKDDVKLLSQRADSLTSRNSHWRFCHLCQVDSPSRAHHCPICDACILKRDHHCFLTGSCIGYHNQRYFIVFLHMTALSCVTAARAMYVYLGQNGLELMSWSFYRILPPFSFMDYRAGTISLLTLLIMHVFLICSVGSFFAAQALLHQFILVALGCTSFELKNSDLSYSEGVLRNFRSVFGNWGVLLFVWPFTFLPYGSDGLSFRKKDA